MSNGKAETQALLNEAIPFAEEMLAKYGELFPFARALGPSGDVISIVGYDGREHPPSDEVINLLERGLRRGAAAGEYVTTALVYDVRLTPKYTARPTDAIAAELEHVGGCAVTVFFPYCLQDGRPRLGSPFATAASRAIFSD